MEDSEEKYEPWSFHTCKFCPYRSNSAVVMYRHETYHKKSEFETFVCDAKPPEMYRCKFCEFETDFKVNLTEHFYVYHGEGQSNMLENIMESYLCENCDFLTYSLLVFARHVHINCKRQFVSDLEKQEDNHKWYEYEWGGSKWFRCKHCFHETLYKQVIKCHVTTHSNENSGKKTQIEGEKRIERLGCYICSNCKFRTASLVEITRHFNSCNFKKVVQTAINDDKFYKSKSGDMTWLKCKFCTFQTPKRNIIRKHIITGHGNLKTVKWFKCDQCSYKTDDHTKLKRHALAKHTKPEDVKWHKCELCSYKSRWPYAMKKHLLGLHTDPDKLILYKCEQCDFKSKTKAYLQVHIKRKHTIGTDISLFKCGHCSGVFKYKASLNKHMRTKHAAKNNAEANAVQTISVIIMVQK